MYGNWTQQDIEQMEDYALELIQKGVFIEEIEKDLRARFNPVYNKKGKLIRMRLSAMETSNGYIYM